MCRVFRNTVSSAFSTVISVNAACISNRIPCTACIRGENLSDKQRRKYRYRYFNARERMFRDERKLCFDKYLQGSYRFSPIFFCLFSVLLIKIICHTLSISTISAHLFNLHLKMSLTLANLCLKSVWAKVGLT